MADTVKIYFVGGQQWLVDVETWRERMQSEVGDRAAEAARRVMVRAQAAYPRGKTGNLRDGVIVSASRSSTASNGAAVMQVEARSGAPHAHLYEWGTTTRTTRTRPRRRKDRAAETLLSRLSGLNRGRMPVNPVFIPIAIQERQAFFDALVAIADQPDPSLGDYLPGVQVVRD